MNIGVVVDADAGRNLRYVGAFSELNYTVELNYSLRKRLINLIGMNEEMADFISLWIMSPAFLESDQGQRVDTRLTQSGIHRDPRRAAGSQFVDAAAIDRRPQVAGAVDNEASDEDDALEQLKRFLSYLPSSIDEAPPRGPRTDDPARREEQLFDAIPRDPRKVYRIRPIVEKIVDQGSFFEMGKLYGRSVVTAFARVDGWPVAVMASDPMFYGGGWTADACQKVARFVDLAETFHLPVIYFCDCPGFLIGLEAEKSGVIRQGVRAMSAMFQTTVPWCSFIIRNAFGVAGAAHQNGARLNWRYAWPSGRWGSLPLEGGIEAAYSADIAGAADPKAKMAEIGDRLNKLRSPFRSAETFWIEEIVDPRDTRKILCEFVELAAPVRGSGPSRHWMRP